jgi:hypothetical protein
MPGPAGSSAAIPWVLAVVAIAGLVTFAAARDEDDPPVTTTTTTTFPRAGYLQAIATALEQQVHELDAAGARCIAGAMVDTLGADGLEALAEEPAPLAALTPAQRDQVLRLVVTCLDPAVAEAILGSGASTTEPVAGLPDEGG